MEIQYIMNDLKRLYLWRSFKKMVNETKLCYRVCVSFVGFFKTFFFFKWHLCEMSRLVD